MIGARLTGDVASIGTASGVITLVEGRSFCLSAPSGDIEPNTVEGLFVLDTRALSLWQLRINSEPVEGLSVDQREPFAADFAGRAQPPAGRSDAELVVFRRRRVGRGMYERIEVVNHGTAPATVSVELWCDNDFAGIFEVKNGRVHPRERRAEHDGPGRLVLRHDEAGGTYEVAIWATPAPTVGPGRLTWRPVIEPGARWEACCEITVCHRGSGIEPMFRCGQPEEDTVPSKQLASWRARLPEIASASEGLDATIARSGDDLGSLRIYDAEHPEVPILAAGAPWYMTLFGRDAILTAWMTLIADRSLAHGVLQTLARLQGSDTVERTEEEPGKILHEVRLDLGDSIRLASGDIYYGSIDATPLFVMLLAEARRWGLPRDAVTELLPHADRALDWIEHFGDRDGDGYVEYQRRTPDGLANQGWKDSWDAIRFADGRFAEPPIALCEVQAYVYGAYLARAELACELGDDTTAERYLAKARELRRRFNRDFWLEDRGWYALALDADKQPVDALASNVGHCLWAEIAEPDHAERIATQLRSTEMFSGWGVRTMATSMAAYNPVSYHNGSVWPHDNAIVAAGLARYGFHDEANRIIRAQLEVANRAGGRLPELFAGFDRGEFGTPAAYPSSCSPQAWAAAAPLLWLRILLGLDADAPHGRLWVHPVLPDWVTPLRVNGIDVAGTRVSIASNGDRPEVTVVGAGLEVRTEARPVRPG